MKGVWVLKFNLEEILERDEEVEDLLLTGEYRVAKGEGVLPYSPGSGFGTYRRQPPIVRGRQALNLVERAASMLHWSAAMFRRGLLALDRETSFSWLPRIELPSFASVSFHSLVCSSLVDTCTEVTVEDVLPRHDPSDG
ncbi:hypothetical protein BHM03_00054082 [Ensete ventricosum]|nr:hypothetical protein BHM03_00054082 [Ensete ventricosum]